MKTYFHLEKRGLSQDHASHFGKGALRALLCALPLLFPISTLWAQDARQSSCEPDLSVFAKGEELVYEVSYLGVALGSISTRVTRIDTLREGVRVHADCLIRTYKGVPFVTLNTLFSTVMDEVPASTAFRNKEFRSEENAFKYIEYIYKARKDVVYINEYIENVAGSEKRDTLDLEGKRWQDGLSLFFYARAFSHARCVKQVPVLMYRSKATTSIRFGVERDEVDIDAVKYDIRVMKLEGETGFTGIFGLTGGFEGWFSDDEASVPIVAKMHVLIGSVRIELIKWKRAGWKPPRAAN